MSINLTLSDVALPVPGIRLAATYAGLRNTPRNDLVLLEIQSGTVAAVFTQNRFCAAPVELARQHLLQTTPRYLLINAANANAGTGAEGMMTALACCTAVAEQAGCEVAAVLPFSTGVIGQPLAYQKIQQAIPMLYQQLATDQWSNAAQAIMTTDTVVKMTSLQCILQGQTVTLTGMAKGSGMICPNMATMLGFCATDAKIAPELLQALHKEAVAISFNAITVDGDTSTNDACILMATGASNVKVQPNTVDCVVFWDALKQLYQHLALMIVRDAEGATKFVKIRVEQGSSVAICEAIARTVAHSPLVKTALFASDANWGRILAAVGRAGVALDINLINLAVNGVQILSKGQPDPSYTEERGATAFAQSEIEILIQLGQGQHQYTIWTSDLTHEYIRINANYRT